MHLTRIATWVMGTLAALTLGSLLLGFLLPSTWSAEATIEIEAPPEAIYAYLESAEGWARWTPSPNEGIEPFGPERGVGSGRSWDDPGYGSGRFEITFLDPNREVRYLVLVEDGAIRIEGHLVLEPFLDAAGSQRTRIAWEEFGDFGWNPMLGYLAGRMSTLQGEQLQASLETLRLEIEGASTPQAAMS